MKLLKRDLAGTPEKLEMRARAKNLIEFVTGRPGHDKRYAS